MNMLEFWSAIWDAISSAEAAAVGNIAGRATALGIYHDEQVVRMDVLAVHGLCCELRLEELAQADDVHFIHDLAGIKQHLQRNTNICLRNHFLPRHATGEPGILAGEDA